MTPMEKANITVGDPVSVTARHGDIFHDFTGTVCAIRDDGIISVVDQDDDVWDCDPDQVELEE